MKFITNRYIYTKDNKTKLKVEVGGISVSNFLLKDEIFGIKSDTLREKLDGVFFDYKYPFDYLYFDEDVIVVNGEVIPHYLLDIDKRQAMFGDLTPYQTLFNKYLKKDMIVVSFEKKIAQFIDNPIITPFEAINLIDRIKVKTQYGFIPLNKLNFVHYPSKITLKINKEYNIFTKVKGIVKFRYEIKGGLNIYLGDKLFQITIKDLL